MLSKGYPGEGGSTDPISRHPIPKLLDQLFILGVGLDETKLLARLFIEQIKKSE